MPNRLSTITSDAEMNEGGAEVRLVRRSLAKGAWLALLAVPLLLAAVLVGVHDLAALAQGWLVLALAFATGSAAAWTAARLALPHVSEVEIVEGSR